MLARATDADPKLTSLKQAVQTGHWDTVKNPNIKEFTQMSKALAIVDGIVCRADKIIVPEALQKQVIEIAHESHQGITKTKQYVRSTMWFAKMDQMIEERLKSCHLCQAVVDSPRKDPIHTTEMPKGAWNTLCTDIFGPLPTGEYLVLVHCLQSR